MNGMHTTAGRKAATVIGLVLALASGACSTSAGSSAPVATPIPTVAPASASVVNSATTSSAAPSSAAVATSAGGETNVTVWTLSSTTKDGVGTYLVAESSTGEDALTVYVFAKDVRGSGASACDATCAKTWPPLILKDGATVDSSAVTGKVGQLTRADGSVQVTYDGAPLYFYKDDHGAGDTNGQGASASWTAARP